LTGWLEGLSLTTGHLAVKRQQIDLEISGDAGEDQLPTG